MRTKKNIYNIGTQKFQVHTNNFIELSEMKWLALTSLFFVYYSSILSCPNLNSKYLLFWFQYEIYKKLVKFKLQTVIKIFFELCSTIVFNSRNNNKWDTTYYIFKSKVRNIIGKNLNTKISSKSWRKKKKYIFFDISY